jgi:hypothetical protein
MQVSMDGLRKSMIADYNLLVRKLNANIKDKSFDPHIIISPEELQGVLDRLRECIVTLAFCYIDKEFDSLPEETHFEEFNPQQ